VHWWREEVTAEAARVFSDRAAGKRYRVLMLSERDGTFSVYHVELPGEWLHAFLFDCEDEPGEGEQVLSVEVVD
jgi:hypothetical protein